MTVREKFEEMLYMRGIWDDESNAIMDYAIPLIDSEMQAGGIISKITWNRPAEEYPESLYGLLMLTHLNKRVVEWADKNAPLAWWKPMFM